MQRFVLRYEVMQTWPSILWIVFSILIFVLVSILIFVLYLYYVFDLLITYAVLAMILVIVFVVKSRKAKSVHVHHYTVGMIVISFIGY